MLANGDSVGVAEFDKSDLFEAEADVESSLGVSVEGVRSPSLEDVLDVP